MLFAALLLARLGCLVAEELEDKPACRLPIYVDVKEDPRPVGGRHIGKILGGRVSWSAEAAASSSSGWW